MALRNDLRVQTELEEFLLLFDAQKLQDILHFTS